jgi:mannose-6-phosphate isomerase-like protein (cupin superfamily)
MKKNGIFFCLFKGLKAMRLSFPISILLIVLMGAINSFGQGNNMPAGQVPQRPQGQQAPGQTPQGQQRPQGLQGPVMGAPMGQPQAQAQEKAPLIPLSQRIGHTDPSKQMLNSAHDGAGKLGIQTLLGRNAIAGLNFMHHGPLMPKSSIGHHFHFDSDEMFLILDGDCQFTVNGNTVVLPGPVGVPCTAGNSHAVYNPSDKPVDWVNFNIKVANPLTSGPAAGGMPAFGARNAFNIASDPTGTFNLGDDRANVKIDKNAKATFLHTSQLSRASLRPYAHMDGGKDTVFYRRTIGPSAFVSNWAYVDHYLVPAGASIGRHFHEGVEEVYFVIKGKGTVYVNDENAEIVYGDAVPVRAKEIHSIENNTKEPLEMVVYGVALEKGKLDVTDVPLKVAKLQMFFAVDPAYFDSFINSYTEVYVPALRKQVGYMGSKLLRAFPEDVMTKIGGAKYPYNFEMELMFDTEEHRVMWTKTKEHDFAWQKTIEHVTKYEWRGYDIVGVDQVIDQMGPRNFTTEEK